MSTHEFTLATLSDAGISSLEDAQRKLATCYAECGVLLTGRGYTLTVGGAVSKAELFETLKKAVLPKLVVAESPQHIAADGSSQARFDLKGDPGKTVRLSFMGTLPIDVSSLVLDKEGRGSFTVGPFQGVLTDADGMNIAILYEDDPAVRASCVLVISAGT
jgi:hypothetical protein